MQFLIDHKVELLSAALALSEVLALVPSFKSSGILDFVIKTLKSLSAPSIK